MIALSRFLACCFLGITISSCSTFYLPRDSGKITVIPDFHSKYVPARQIEIYQPPAYDPEGHYPVIYLHDGQNVFDSTTAYGGVEWGLDETLDSLIKGNYIPPVIAVAIHNSKYRWNEYLPQDCLNSNLDSSRLMPYARNQIWDTAVYSDDYLRFIVEELKPFVDGFFQADPGISYIMGSSMGGLISVYAVSKYPEVFSGSACLSTHWPALDGNCLPIFQESIAELRDHKFYFDHGTAGLDSLYKPYQHVLDSTMLHAGFDEGNYRNSVFPGADHNEKSWQKRVHEPLIFLFANWQNYPM